MSRLDNDRVFHTAISRMGGYGLTQEYLDGIVDKCFPTKSDYKFSDALKFDGMYEAEDLYEANWDK